MTPSLFSKNIKLCWTLLDELALGSSFSVPTSLNVNTEFRDLALEPGTQYVDLYKSGLALKHYNFLLKDNSYFQYSLIGDDVRLAYLPCPFVTDNDDFLVDLETSFKAELLSWEDYQSLMEEIEERQTIPTVRYEYAEGQYREFLHPCSHFHIGHHSDNRWPVNRYLSPLAFTMIILKKYYQTHWDASADDGHTYKNPLNEKMAIERRKCPILYDTFFSDNEKEVFYIT